MIFGCGYAAVPAVILMHYNNRSPVIWCLDKSVSWFTEPNSPFWWTFG